MSKARYPIDEMNPFLKIIILTLITIIGSTDFFPFLSSTLVLSGAIIVVRFSSLSFKEILYSMRAFIILSLGFMNIILITRLLSGQDLELLRVTGLGLRIILISFYTTVFVKTTDPTELTMSLIKYMKIKPKYGYSFLSAYRFLPNFKDEIEIIKHAHQVRGVEESKNPLMQVWNSKRYMIPMLATAVRKGVRLSIAMQTRGFDKYETRTYYRELSLDRSEIVASSVFILYIIGLIVLLGQYGLTNFTLIYG